ncbi:MAG: LPS export ABC transporter permease LptF [Candidatus Thiodiazotropha sp. DIVDIV]
MITLIDRYLLKEVLKAMSAILLVLTLILSSNSFIKLLKEVATGDLNTELLAQALALQMVVYFSRLIPPAFFFAVLYVVGRMYRDSEMVALESCGIGGMRIYRSMILVVIPVALITGWLSLYVTPWAGRMSAELLSSQRGQAMELAGVSAGRFNEYSQGDLVLYVESITNKTRMENVFVQQRKDGELTLVSAKRGYQRFDAKSGDRYLVLEEGLRYAGSPGQADYQVSEFNQYALLIKAATGGETKVTRRSLSSQALLNSDSIKDRAEFQVRLSQVLGLLVFAILSLPLSRTMPRQGPFGRLVFAFVLYTVYLSLQGAAENWMVKATTPEWLGIWWVHLLLAITGLLLLLPDTPLFRRVRRRFRMQAV